ncbi:cytochrome P450 [Nocardia niigatensis]
MDQFEETHGERVVGCPMFRYPSETPRSLSLDPVLEAVRNGPGIARLQYPHGGPCWVVTSYDDVRFVYSDRAFSRSGMMQDSAPRLTAGLLLQGGIGSLDDGTHSRLRRAINKELGSRRMVELRRRAEAIMAELLEPVEEAGRCDYVAEVAKPFALRVLGELLGIPRADQRNIAGWVDALLSDASDAGADAEAAVKELGRYVTELIGRRRRDPGTDLVSAFAAGEHDLEKWEVITIVFSLIVGGFESSAHMIGKAVLRVLIEPELRGALRERPESIAEAVEELLRTTALAGGESLPWIVREPVQLAGIDMAPGDYVMPAVGAANLDPRVFDDSANIVFGRPPRAHMAFGHGTRYCLGAQIARMELQVAVGTVVSRYPGMRLAVPAEEIEWRSGSAVWQLARLPIRLPAQRVSPDVAQHAGAR